MKNQLVKREFNFFSQEDKSCKDYFRELLARIISIRVSVKTRHALSQRGGLSQKIFKKVKNENKLR